jgi:hypothetical protein
LPAAKVSAVCPLSRHTRTRSAHSFAVARMAPSLPAIIRLRKDVGHASDTC